MEETTGKDAYLMELEQQVETLQEDVRALGAQIEKGPEEGKERFAEMRRTLDRKRDEIQRRLQEAREKGDRAWTDLKAGLEDAWQELKEATERAKGHFDD